jgi:hypothetical protein
VRQPTKIHSVIIISRHLTARNAARHRRGESRRAASSKFADSQGRNMLGPKEKRLCPIAKRPREAVPGNL